MKILKRTGWILASVLATGLAVGAQSQQPAPKPEEKKPVKKKKVWTQEDLAGLRTARDEYVDKKAAEEAAAKAAAEQQAAAAQAGTESKPGEESGEPTVIDPETGKPFVDPDSPEGLQQQITKWEASLASIEADLAAARSRLTQNTDPQRWETAKLEVELLEQNVVDTRQRIDELKAKLAASGGPKKDGSSAAPQTPPPPQPPSR